MRLVRFIGAMFVLASLVLVSVYVADAQQVTTTGCLSPEVPNNACFVGPVGIVKDSLGNIWTANGDNSLSLVRPDPALPVVKFTYTDELNPPASFSEMAIDPATNTIFVRDATNQAIVKFRAGKFIARFPVGNSLNSIAYNGRLWASTFDKVYELNKATGAIVSTFNNVYVFKMLAIPGYPDKVYGMGKALGGWPVYFYTFVSANQPPIISQYWLLTNMNDMVYDPTTKLFWGTGEPSLIVCSIDPVTGWFSPFWGAGTLNASGQGSTTDSNGNLYVTDTTNNVVRRYNIQNPLVPTLAGVYPAGAYPNKLVWDGANVWVTNTGSGNLTKITP